MTRTISRAACEAQMDAKAAPMTTLSRLDFYRELYQANFACMLSGLPYSKQAMDSALNAIMSIAREDEMHQRFGELPRPIAEAIGEEAAKQSEWLGTGEPETIECKECEGVGYVDMGEEYFSVCKVCDGKGRVNTDPSEPLSFTLSDAEQPDEGTDNRASTQWKEHGYF